MSLVDQTSNINDKPLFDDPLDSVQFHQTSNMNDEPLPDDPVNKEPAHEENQRSRSAPSILQLAKSQSHASAGRQLGGVSSIPMLSLPGFPEYTFLMYGQYYSLFQIF